MMQYISPADAAAKWNISVRRVTALCEQGRVSGAYKVGNGWIIPGDAEKPGNPRLATGYKSIGAETPHTEQDTPGGVELPQPKQSRTINVGPQQPEQPKPGGDHHIDLRDLSEPFKVLVSNAGLNHQLLDMLPIPIEIFAPDGTAIFLNRAWMEFSNIRDENFLTTKYNLKNDPVCLEILGQETIDRIFRGETVFIPDFPVPVQDMLDRRAIAEKPWEAATIDMLLLPLWDSGIFAYSVCLVTVKSVYQGRAEIVRAQEYIKEHWLSELDIDQVAHASNLSKRHFQRVFKEVVDCTPLEYYRDIKIKKIQEKLLDGTISIEKAFTDCGVDYHGSYFRLFKEKTGMSPSEYRKEHLKK